MDSAKKPQPSRTPEGIVDALVEHFNTMDIEVMVSLFRDDGLSITASGEALSGKAAITEEFSRYLSHRLPLTATCRHVFVAGDVASVILDWSIAGTSASGEKVALGGSANDVYRRGEDGYWRIAVDNPFGTHFPKAAG